MSEHLTDFFAMMADRPQIKAHSQAFKYKYADSTEVDNATRPLLIKHQFTIIYEMKDQMLIATLRHISGEVMNTVQIPFHDDLIADAQKLGSAMTYYRRYAKLILLDLVVEEEDDDGAKASTKENVVVLDDPGSFVLPLTKNKGRTLKSLTPAQLEWYAKDFKHPETNANAKAYLEQMKEG